MDSNRTDAQIIADEAVGQRPATAIPDASKASSAIPNTEQLANSAGPQASVAALTAESVGERDDGAYAYGDASADEVRKREASSKVRRRLGFTSSEPSYIPLIAGFTLGYSAALLIHRRW
jgi:hypothetical protein